MRNITDSFSNNYVEARSKFIGAAENAGAEIQSVEHPLNGPRGEHLFMDFAVFGPGDAENAIVITSGTHGPELFCGSGVQVQLLSMPGELDKYRDTRLVFVHAHNPYGCAWLRRVNEDNIDINRNYCDFDRLYPQNEAYNSVRDLFLPKEFNDDARNAILAWAEENGMQKFATVALSGQRVDPRGIFYGGHEPVWSRETMYSTLPGLLAKQKRAVLLDFHTGVGEYGQGTILHLYGRDSAEDQLFKSWFEGKVAGEMEEIDNDEIDHAQGGAFMSGFHRILPDHETYSLVVEYGTVGIQRVLFALIADNWLHAKGDPDGRKGQEIKREILSSLYGNSPEWHAGVWKHGSWLIERTALGMRSL